LLGLACCRYFGIPLYDWRGAPFRQEQLNHSKQQPIDREINASDLNGSANKKNAIAPDSRNRLFGIRALPNYLVILFLLGMFLIAEVNAFYMKALLWIPSSHVLNWTRMWIIAFMGLIAVADIYRYATDLSCLRLGFAARLMIFLLTLELLVVISFSRGEFPESVPSHVIRLWTGIGLCLIAYPALQYARS
jgi:phosphatidylserine synthase 2